MIQRLLSLLLVLGAAVSTNGVALAQEDPTVFDAPWSLEYEQTMVQRMVEGIDAYFDRYTDRVLSQRGEHWNRDLSSRDAYAASVMENRKRLEHLIGLADTRLPTFVERFGREDDEPVVAETEAHEIEQVRWPVLHGIWGEGLLITPTSGVQARVVALADADQAPEDIAGLAGSNPWAAKLAARGIQVLIPVLINRENTFSMSRNVVPWNYPLRTPTLETFQTNLPHREWIYRMAYPNGRHIIGVEVQKVQSALDWFLGQGDEPIGVAGYGEGGLIALHAAAVDERIDAALVSGYYGPRANLWSQPVYRNVWGVLREFGMAEIASLVTPRPITIEYSETPQVGGPPETGRSASAGGEIHTPPFPEVDNEVRRIRSFFDGGRIDVDVTFLHNEGAPVTPMSPAALMEFATDLGIPESAPQEVSSAARDTRRHFDTLARQERQVREMQDYFHALVDTLERSRYTFFQGDRSSAAAWDASMQPYREFFRREIIGVVDQDLLAPNPRLRKVHDEETWEGHEVVLDVWPGVFAWGMLALPKDLEAGEKRPTVVVQHGIGGTPSTPERVDSYHRLTSQLTERGFVVFSVHAPYQFDVLRATPLKASVYSVIIPQYRQIVNWLTTTEHVDPERLGYYGKSWGGRTGLRVPLYIPEFKFSISSAYLNMFTRKLISAYFRTSYMYEGSIGVYEFNMGPTIAHAEMVQMLAPRPFLAEAGHRDAVGASEWVAYEFAKAKRTYDLLGIGDRIVLGFHSGGHETHADTIFPFIHKHLQWPVPATK